MQQKSEELLPAGQEVERKTKNDGERDKKLECKTRGHMNYKRSANLDEMMENGQDSANNGFESSGLTLPEAIGSEQMVERDGHSTKTKCISAPAGQSTPDEHSLESGITEQESNHLQLRRMCKSKNKKDLNLPRRASKRLAGLEVDPLPELKASTRARRVATKQLGESAGCVLQQSDQRLEFEPKKQDYASVVQEKDDKAEEGPEFPQDSPLADFFTDPCIAFAIKTLKDHSESADSDYKVYKNHESNVPPPPNNIPIQEKHDLLVGTDEKPGSSSFEQPFGSSWPDPCIEFAIKTLTGAIPLEYDPRIEEYFQQQLSSSRRDKDNFLQKEIT